MKQYFKHYKMNMRIAWLSFLHTLVHIAHAIIPAIGGKHHPNNEHEAHKFENKKKESKVIKDCKDCFWCFVDESDDKLSCLFDDRTIAVKKKDGNCMFHNPKNIRFRKKVYNRNPAPKPSRRDEKFLYNPDYPYKVYCQNCYWFNKNWFHTDFDKCTFPDHRVDKGTNYGYRCPFYCLSKKELEKLPIKNKNK